MAQNSRRFSFFNGDYSNHPFSFSCSSFLFSGTSIATGKQATAFSIWWRGGFDFSFLWAVCFIRFRNHQTSASITFGFNYYQQHFFPARVIYHNNRFKDNGGTERRNPDSGSDFPSCISGSWYCVYRGDYIELERVKKSQIKIFIHTPRLFALLLNRLNTNVINE